MPIYILKSLVLKDVEKILCEKLKNILTKGVMYVIILTVEQPFNCIFGKEIVMNSDIMPPPVCECEELHPERIAAKRGEMPEDATLYDLADFFKIFGDSTRISILFAIDGCELCVCGIASLLGMTKSAVSHQLKILRQSALVKYRKVGKNVFYSLADEHVRDIIEKALEHIKE